MSFWPRVIYNEDKLEQNARTVVEICHRSGLGVFGVTKGVCGSVRVAEVMLGSGCIGIADSRIRNLARLRDALPTAALMMLRSPMLSEVAEVGRSVDLVLCSDADVASGLRRHSDRSRRAPGVILMLDMGDRREGVLPEKAPRAAREIDKACGGRLVGVGTNLACFGGVAPTRQVMSEFIEAAGDVESAIERRLEHVSAGNSSSLHLLLDGWTFGGATHLRIGESILLGKDIVTQEPISGLHQDAFLLEAEVIELGRKRVRHLGEIGWPVDEGVTSDQLAVRNTAILAVGRQDVRPEGLLPIAEGVKVLGASSDHLLIDIEDAADSIAVGDRVQFMLDYKALLSLMTSPYVDKGILSREVS